MNSALFVFFQLTKSSVVITHRPTEQKCTKLLFDFMSDYFCSQFITEPTRLNDLHEAISTDTHIALYADNTKIWRSIKNEEDIAHFFILGQLIIQLNFNLINVRM